ncbi:hypothetical protein SASPL_124538 [Salvia splendens]|uniref:RING-type domain-containing protein n=1 Tax=Salvia splendens TaxID=180675 RepID=A0A8X8XC90_SALSN|nr:hypothetical protein SASPL_124538 [Salvia splendens]
METDGGPSKFTRAVSTRTLTDVIHDDPDDDDPKEELRGWKHFKEKIGSQGRRAGSGAAWTSSVSVPASDVPVQTSQNRVMFRHPSGRVSAAPESDPGMLQGAEIGAVQQDFLSSSLRRNSSGRNERSGRHKGAAFDPCGHSFCRLCSREMWVQGGNCPLCNNYVLEILDIF